jgi:hypothetical protein
MGEGKMEFLQRRKLKGNMNKYIVIPVSLIMSIGAESAEFCNIADLLYKADSFEEYQFGSKKINESVNCRSRAAFYVLEITIAEKDSAASLMHMVKVANCLAEIDGLPNDFRHCRKDLFLLVDVIRWSMTTTGVSDAYKILRKSTNYGPLNGNEIEKLSEVEVGELCREWKKRISSPGAVVSE